MCSNDADCGEAELCLEGKVQWDNTTLSWTIFNQCEEVDESAFMRICELIGDFTRNTGEYYEARGAAYSMSHNCERFIPVDIGGAHAIVATFFATLAALLLVN